MIFCPPMRSITLQIEAKCRRMKVRLRVLDEGYGTHSLL